MTSAYTGPVMTPLLRSTTSDAAAARVSPLPIPAGSRSDNPPSLGTLGAQSGHSRRSRKDSDHSEMPVPLSAPGVNRTPDLQVRSLTNLLAQPIAAHRSPVTTRF